MASLPPTDNSIPPHSHVSTASLLPRLPSELSEFQNSVVDACAETVNALDRTRSGRRYLTWGNYFIKFGGSHFHDVAATQRYIYQQAIQDENAPRVPKVLDCFSHGPTTYLVMEHIPGKTVQKFIETESSRELVYSEVAKALNWLRGVPAPPEARIGPVGDGFAHHRVFQDWTAPLKFSSTHAMQIYINKASMRNPPRGRPPPVDFGQESEVFTQSDMDEGNFLVDETGRICLVDFNGVGRLPESFASYTVHATCEPFVKGVARYLGWPESPNLASLQSAARILIMTGDTTLGLDEDGNTRQKKSRHNLESGPPS